MIFYFTGTGNSLAAAQAIAQETDDLLVDIGAAYKYKNFDFILEQGETLGFVFPTYAWTTPPLIDSFIKRVRFRTGNQESFAPHYCFAVITCGAFVGNTAHFFADELRENQGITLNASFSVKSVGNCTYLYAPAEGERRESLLAAADQESHRIAQRIAARECVHAEHRNPFGILMSVFTGKDEKPRSTTEFYALNNCIHCGQCADLCPTNTITLIEGSPRWAELGCTQCLACLHRCPVNAIQYGKKTETRGRYVNPILTDAPKRA
ncbi:MAG: EFR1 family ferrodoxin [Gordonibacter sp.]|nr:EFR1 family ferrodoxin [Gordonibacter sp.]